MSEEDWFEEAIDDSETSTGRGSDGASDDDAGRAPGSDSGGGTAGDPDESADRTTDDGIDTDPPGTTGPADEDPTGVDPDASDGVDRDATNATGGSATDDSHAPSADEGAAGGDGLFEEDFAAALDDAALRGDARPDPADEGFSMGTDSGGGFGDVGVEEVDGELDSDIPRIELGIEGLDDMIQGGVPERSLMVSIGSAGTGKTTFGLQFLHHALAEGERAVFIALEESRERVIRSATEKGYAFDEYAEEGSLAVVDLDPVEMANSLQTIRSELPRLIDDFGASRLVLDSVSLLEMMYDDQAKRRNEIYDFTKSLKDAGVTTMLTSEASEDTPYASRHGIVEYLTDAVFILQYVRPSDFRETRMAIEIQKIRDANHSRETKPYEITNEGIDVYRQANLF